MVLIQATKSKPHTHLRSFTPQSALAEFRVPVAVSRTPQLSVCPEASGVFRTQRTMWKVTDSCLSFPYLKPSYGFQLFGLVVAISVGEQIGALLQRKVAYSHDPELSIP